jgi:hypothetical protein
MKCKATLSEKIRLVLESETDNFVELTKISGLDPSRAFRYADLSGTDFSGLDLSGFDFTGARLDDCKFNNAYLEKTVFSGNDYPVDALNKLSAIVELPDPRDAPDIYIRQLHRSWKERGGIHLGKPRHSDRYLENALKRNGSPVRALTHKLSGRTRVGAKDGLTLTSFLLCNWPRFAPETKSVEYTKIIDTADIYEISTFVSLKLRERLVAYSTPHQHKVAFAEHKHENFSRSLHQESETTGQSRIRATKGR